MIDQDDGKAMNSMKAAKLASAKEDVRKRKAQARKVEQDLEQSRKLRSAAEKLASNRTLAASAGQDDSVPSLPSPPKKVETTKKPAADLRLQNVAEDPVTEEDMDLMDVDELGDVNGLGDVDDFDGAML